MKLCLYRQVALLFPSTLFAYAAVSSPTTTVAHLPNVQINAAKVDASGKIYLVGSASGAAYIAKLNADGSTVYAVNLGGSGSSTSAAYALDLDSSGNVYVAGTTTASDFPISPGLTATPGSTAFAAKLDPKGTVLYSTLIGGNTTAVPRTVAVNSKGELVVSGQQTAAPPSSVPSLFLLKLSADATQVAVGPAGIGGLVAVDSADNIYVAGIPPFGVTGPAATAGAFQSLPPTYYCGCPFLSFACGGDQFVASVTSDLSRTRFLTYITAHYGARPVYMALDAQANVLLAGTTSAPAYPTTAASYEPTYSAESKIELSCGPPIPLQITSPSGYVTLVKNDGSGLLFSTFFSGSKSDELTFAAMTGAGIYLGGRAGSVDLPGFNGGVPSACVPVGFVSRMTLDGSAVSSSHTPPGTPLAVDSTNGTLLLASGSDLVRFDPTQPTSIACVLDSADLSPVSSVAPGELLTMYGRFRYYATEPVAAALTPVKGSFPTTFQGQVGVAANQTPTPLLYVSEPQINFQAPYEIASSPQASFTVTYSDVNGNQISDARTIPVTATNPVAFLSQPANLSQNFPLTLNTDGSTNSQKNPAAAQSVVTMFIEGIGGAGPLPTTGLVNTSPVPLTVPVTVAPVCGGTFCNPAPTLVSASALPGSISGVIQVQLLTPANSRPQFPFWVEFSLSVGSVAVRNPNLAFWVQ